MQNNRPVILITNDDGVTAKGINSLVDSLREVADIVVVAPDGARSGQSSAITSNIPLRLTKIKDEEGLTVYKTNGTPVDCVKLSIHQLFKDKHPDMIVSGINHGSNAAISILYSGTMGAVLEGCVLGIPSIGFSLCSFDPNADFTPAYSHIKSIVSDILDKGMNKGICLNVNFPMTDEYKGVRICRQAEGHWTQEYVKGTDPFGNDYFWLTGSFNNLEPEAMDTDEWALREGYVSIVPCKIDMTCHNSLPNLTFLAK